MVLLMNEWRLHLSCPNDSETGCLVSFIYLCLLGKLVLEGKSPACNAGNFITCTQGPNQRETLLGTAEGHLRPQGHPSTDLWHRR